MSAELEGRPPGKCHYHVVYHSALSLGIGRRLHAPLSLVLLACARGWNTLYIRRPTDGRTDRENKLTCLDSSRRYICHHLHNEKCLCVRITRV